MGLGNPKLRPRLPALAENIQELPHFTAVLLLLLLMMMI